MRMAGPGRPPTRFVAAVVEKTKKFLSPSRKKKKTTNTYEGKDSPSSTPNHGSVDSEENGDDDTSIVSSGESIRSIRGKSIAATGTYKLGEDSDGEDILSTRRGRVPAGKYKIGKQKSKLVFENFEERPWATLPEFFDMQVCPLIQFIPWAHRILEKRLYCTPLLPCSRCSQHSLRCRPILL